MSQLSASQLSQVSQRPPYPALPQQSGLAPFDPVGYANSSNYRQVYDAGRQNAFPAAPRFPNPTPFSVSHATPQSTASVNTQLGQGAFGSLSGLVQSPQPPQMQLTPYGAQQQAQLGYFSSSQLGQSQGFGGYPGAFQASSQLGQSQGFGGTAGFGSVAGFGGYGAGASQIGGSQAGGQQPLLPVYPSSGGTRLPPVQGGSNNHRVHQEILYNAGLMQNAWMYRERPATQYSFTNGDERSRRRSL